MFEEETSLLDLSTVHRCLNVELWVWTMKEEHSIKGKALVCFEYVKYLDVDADSSICANNRELVSVDVDGSVCCAYTEPVIMDLAETKNRGEIETYSSVLDPTVIVGINVYRSDHSPHMTEDTYMGKIE